MHISHALWASALLAGIGWIFAASGSSALHTVVPPAVPAPPPPPIADGHYVLVVDGDRDQLNIQHARAKVDPWAGVAKGWKSDWVLTIHDDRGELLAEVPLDVTPFATAAADKGRPVHVEGCRVSDSHIAMLVNAPRFATAASYTFSRPADGAGRLVIGTTTGAAVRQMAEQVR